MNQSVNTAMDDALLDPSLFASFLLFSLYKTRQDRSRTLEYDSEALG
jgi:hypothetical protein